MHRQHVDDVGPVVATPIAVAHQDLTTFEAKLIPMPSGVITGTVVADEQTHTVWVSNCPTPWC